MRRAITAVADASLLLILLMLMSATDQPVGAVTKVSKVVVGTFQFSFWVEPESPQPAREVKLWFEIVQRASGKPALITDSVVSVIRPPDNYEAIVVVAGESLLTNPTYGRLNMTHTFQADGNYTVRLTAHVWDQENFLNHGIVGVTFFTIVQAKRQYDNLVYLVPVGAVLFGVSYYALRKRRRSASHE